MAGRVLVLHGGVGDGSWGLKELAEVRRPLDDAHAELVALQVVLPLPRFCRTRLVVSPLLVTVVSPLVLTVV